ncbi:MAG TPA: hypothetical protein VE890_14680 [Thermoguttaceae bacterium]|nr:hypothetical protein [Thermoguttaceae bacterium]
MGDGSAKSVAALGFLTVLDHPQHGLFGGYLVLNLVGRPIEFHCSAPIKPNRAQQILYGPTLEAFLYGEQIGQALVAKAKVQPLSIFTDRRPAMAVREHISPPVALVIPPQTEVSTSTEDGKFYRLDSAHDRGAELVSFDVGQNRLAVFHRTEGDRQLISQRLEDIGESFDLSEPFGRIREAIEEAQQAAR